MIQTILALIFLASCYKLILTVKNKHKQAKESPSDLLEKMKTEALANAEKKEITESLKNKEEVNNYNHYLSNRQKILKSFIKDFVYFNVKENQYQTLYVSRNDNPNFKKMDLWGSPGDINILAIQGMPKFSDIKTLELVAADFRDLAKENNIFIKHLYFRDESHRGAKTFLPLKD